MAKHSAQSVVDTHAWCQVLTADERARVVRDMDVRRYCSGSEIQRKGVQTDGWIGVVEGLAKISTVSSLGKSVTFTGVPPGGWLGEGSLLKREVRKYDVVALRDCVIASVPRITFEWLLETSLPFNRHLLIQINERLGQFIAMVEHERLLEPDARVARSLAELFNPILYPGCGPRLAISQEEIGYLSGVSRQRVNQALKVLEEAELLKIEYGAVLVLSLDGLRRFI